MNSKDAKNGNLMDDKRYINMINSARKQSMPVASLIKTDLGYSLKKPRKQSDNIIFKSTDGWKKKKLTPNGNTKIMSRSGVIMQPIKLPNVQRDLKLENSPSQMKLDYNETDKDLMDLQPESNLIRELSGTVDVKSPTKISKQTTLYPEGKSEFVDYSGLNPFKYSLSGNLSNEIRMVPPRDSSDNLMADTYNNGSIPLFDHNTLSKKEAKRDQYQEDRHSGHINFQRQFFRETLTPDLVKRRGYDSMNAQRKNSCFGVKPLTVNQMSADFKYGNNWAQFVEKNSQGFPEQSPSGIQFSLAKQNDFIDRQLSKQKKIEDQKIVTGDFELNKMQKTDPDMSEDNSKTSSNFKLGGFLKSQNEGYISQELLFEHSNSPMYPTKKKDSTPARSRKNKFPRKSNDLKKRLKKKKKKLELGRQEQKQKQKQKQKKDPKLDQELKRLKNLLKFIDEQQSANHSFSQLDINLMKTLSKSFLRSKMFLNTRSRYSFAQQDKPLSPSDILCGEKPPANQREAESEVLSIVKVIKAFISPESKSSRDPKRRDFADPQEFKGYQTNT